MPPLESRAISSPRASQVRNWSNFPAGPISPMSATSVPSSARSAAFSGFPLCAAGLTLTARQKQVAELVSQVLTNRDIARRLGIDERSAEGHVERIRNPHMATSTRARRDPMICRGHRARADAPTRYSAPVSMKFKRWRPGRPSGERTHRLTLPVVPSPPSPDRRDGADEERPCDRPQSEANRDRRRPPLGYRHDGYATDDAAVSTFRGFP